MADRMALTWTNKLASLSRLKNVMAGLALMRFFFQLLIKGHVQQRLFCKHTLCHIFLQCEVSWLHRDNAPTYCSGHPLYYKAVSAHQGMPLEYCQRVPAYQAIPLKSCK